MTLCMTDMLDLMWPLVNTDCVQSDFPTEERSAALGRGHAFDPRLRQRAGDSAVHAA